MCAETTSVALRNDQGPVIAVYPRHYLTFTMTFVYRQLLAIRDQFHPIVFATSTENLDRFPFDPVFEKRIGFVDRRISRLMRLVRHRFSQPGPGQLRHWRKILRDWDVRLIHAHFGPSGMDMLPLAREMGIPLLVTFHGYDASTLLANTKYIRSLEDLFEYAYIAAVSRRIERRLVSLGADPSRTEVHFVGAPLGDFLPAEREDIRAKSARGDTIHFLQISSFAQKKGQRYTVQAFRKFLDRYPSAILTLAGDGPLRPETERLCRELGVGDRVRFPGAVVKKEVIRLLAQADVFVHHSVTPEDGNEEGVTTAIVEAMATGLPVIATDHGGIPELVREGLDGFLVAERDVEAYADRMYRVMSLPRPDNREYLEREFDLEKNMEKLKALYWKLIRGSSSA